MVHFVGAGPGAPDLITAGGGAAEEGGCGHLCRQLGQSGAAGSVFCAVPLSLTARR